MVQWLRVLPALLEDPSSVCKHHIRRLTHNSSSSGPYTLFLTSVGIRTLAQTRTEKKN